MQVLDWEVVELLRREGNEKALQKVESVLDLSKYAVRLFLGSMRLYPQTFCIGGIWYPKRAAGLLFS